MAVVDKLDRWRNNITAVATMRDDVPFWVTLTPRERRQGSKQDVFWFFKRHEHDRRRFRCFVRNMGDDQYKASKKASALADRYAKICYRNLGNRDSVAYRLACARGWVLRSGGAYGVVCVQ